MKKAEFLVMRHSYDDHSYIDGKNDTSLTKDGVNIAKEASRNILVFLDDREVIIRSSTKKRAIETSEILADSLEKNGLDYKLIKEHGLNELYQGQFNFNGLSHSDRISFLQSCWDDFEKERLNGNIDHHFAEFKNSGVVKNKGEDHRSWSKRIGLTVLNILKDLEQNKQAIEVTHRGAKFAMENIVRMINNEIPTDEVEKYGVEFMKYCEISKLEINSLIIAKDSLKKFITLRKLRNESNN